jgi:hypothetical protein
MPYQLTHSTFVETFWGYKEERMEKVLSISRARLSFVSSECIRLSDDVMDTARTLKDNVRTPREDRVYLHLAQAYEALRAAITECQPILAEGSDG